MSVADHASWWQGAMLLPISGSIGIVRSQAEMDEVHSACSSLDRFSFVSDRRFRFHQQQLLSFNHVKSPCDHIPSFGTPQSRL